MTEYSDYKFVDDGVIRRTMRDEYGEFLGFDWIYPHESRDESERQAERQAAIP